MQLWHEQSWDCLWSADVDPVGSNDRQLFRIKRVLKDNNQGVMPSE